MDQATTGPPTQHQDLPSTESPASASEMAVRLSRLTQAMAETQDRALGLAMDLGAIQAELGTLRAGAIELAMAEPGPFTHLAQEQDRAEPTHGSGHVQLWADGGERSEHRAAIAAARPRPVATVVGQEPWLFAAVVL